MYFSEPFAFFLLLLLPLLWWRLFASRSHGLVVRSGQDYVRSFGRGLGVKSLIFGSVTIALVLFSVVLAEPRVPAGETTIRREGIDIVIVFDISKSMLAEDIAPNRITAAKRVVSEFVASREGDRIGMVLFAGKPFLSIPLTFDYPSIQQSLARVTTDSIEQAVPGLSGTAMGDGILSALRTLSSAESELQTETNERERIVILLTDGEANIGLNPTVAAKLAREREIKIYTVGIGSTEGIELYITNAQGRREYFADATGNPIMARLDEQTLQTVADITNARYFNAQDSDALERVFETLSELDRSELTFQSVQIFRSRIEPFLPFLWVFVALSLLAWMVLARGSTLKNPSLAERSRPLIRATRTGSGITSLLLVMLAIMPIRLLWADADIGRDAVFFLLDTSQSMRVRDIEHSGESLSRLEYAKRLIADTVTETPQRAYGLAAFAGETVGISPLTRDADTFLTFADAMDTDTVIRGGSDLAGALEFVSRWREEDDFPLFVVFTDAENPEWTAQQQLQTFLDENDMPVIFVGVGSEEGGRIPISDNPFGLPAYLQHEEKAVISSLDASLLSSLENATTIRTIINPETLSEAIADFPPQTRRTDDTDTSASDTETDRFLVLLAFAFWLCAGLLPDTSRRTHHAA